MAERKDGVWLAVKAIEYVVLPLATLPLLGSSSSVEPRTASRPPVAVSGSSVAVGQVSETIIIKPSPEITVFGSSDPNETKHYRRSIPFGGVDIGSIDLEFILGSERPDFGKYVVTLNRGAMTPDKGLIFMDSISLRRPHPQVNIDLILDLRSAEAVSYNSLYLVDTDDIAEWTTKFNRGDLNRAHEYEFDWGAGTIRLSAWDRVMLPLMPLSDPPYIPSLDPPQLRPTSVPATGTG